MQKEPDQSIPNQAANKEPAEGSRETVGADRDREKDAKRPNADTNPTLPSDDSTLRTEI